MRPVAYVTGVFAGRFVVQPTDPARVLQAGLALYEAPQGPLTATQQAYLDRLHTPRSLKELSAIFYCTTEGARKHIRVLMSRGLVKRDARFRRPAGERGAWAWYYVRKDAGALSEM